MTNRCKSPWTGIFIETDGSVKSCCAGGYYWGNLYKNTLEEIINSPQVIDIKQQIINDEPVDYCKNCRRDEAATGYSLRNYYEQFTTSDELLNSSTAFVPRNIDIRWNTLCNLNCVYCSEDCSTEWQKRKGFTVESVQRAYYNHVLDYIDQHSDQVEIILLAGGEPLMPKQNKRLLESVGADIPIDLITNLSVNFERCPVFDVLKNKTNVGWKASMETVGQRFEYVRHGAIWDRWLDNVKTVKQLPGHHVTLLSVYNIHSATNLIELYNIARELGVDIHWQPLWGPEYQNVTNFSPAVRIRAVSEIDQLLKQFDVSESNRTFFENMRNKLLHSTVTDYCNQEFLNQSAEFESKYAGDVQPFETLWPELYRLIKHEL